MAASAVMMARCDFETLFAALAFEAMNKPMVADNAQRPLDRPSKVSAFQGRDTDFAFLPCHEQGRSRPDRFVERCGKMSGTLRRSRFSEECPTRNAEDALYMFA